ncbi:xanthine dehydrogenase family protein molybdopterin-binding subunit [Marinobacter sp. SS21]|uniref:xanthine dehydrogenase family protein molybdopterin-binding subunit n=1 Tax=Marinobacter sp. SS21 TaxID=2979460 RepID=UPI00232EA368|nr:molybdopterin cofactor-binding domain-containing protein [Marinobacter sp. SS21]MDC0663438.1 molybdopterin-dependent oxidoreductase [Marinobacter sp. SS21]
MSPTYSRREFLIGSAALAGGVAFGSYSLGVLATTPEPNNPLLTGLGPESATFNPWVKITPEGITLVTPHADVGQGVVAIQAALIAEEMDLELAQFDTDFGPPSPVYYNGGLVEEFAPFMATDLSPEAEAARAAALQWLKEQGMQMTGGSSTVPDSYTKLRVAGAVARETLKAAASKRTGIPVSELGTKAGAVLLPGGATIPYTALAAAAATLAPIEEVTLRDPSQWRLLGKTMQRLDVEAKCTGSLQFGIDLVMDGMVYAAVKLNPHKGAPMTGFNAGKAETMPGVQQIFPVTNGIAVVATNTWYAMKAAEAVECQWAEADYPSEQADHWAMVEATFTPDQADKIWRKDGDMEKALATAEVLEAEYRVPYAAHQPLEPLNAVALVRDDSVEVWTGHQIPQGVEQMAAALTGLQPEQATFYNQYSGGSFGHRLEFEHVRYAVEVANKMRGTPVKLTFSREEDFLQDFPRQIGMGRNRGAVKDGKIIAADFHIATTSAIRSMFGRMGMPSTDPDSQIPSGVWNMTYGIPNFRTTAYAVTGLSPTSSWRSVGAVTAGFIGESFIDELIHAAGQDPLQARIELCTVDYHRKVLEAVAKMADWDGPLGNGQGRGVAFVESFGVPVAEVIDVTATDKGIRIDKVWVAADVGGVLDPINFENQVQGGVVWGLGHAMNCELTYADGRVQQTNFHVHEGMRIHQCPPIEVMGLANGPKIRGIGEPPVPPAGPALANAIFAATGQRIREMPFNKFINFV